MKKGIKYLVSTLVFTCMWLLLFTKKAHADIANTPDTTTIIGVFMFGFIIVAIIVVSYFLIKFIRSKNDIIKKEINKNGSNKPN